MLKLQCTFPVQKEAVHVMIHKRAPKHTQGPIKVKGTGQHKKGEKTAGKYNLRAAIETQTDLSSSLPQLAQQMTQLVHVSALNIVL